MMQSNSDADWHQVCANLRPDDGVPPHRLKKQEQQAAKSGRRSGSHRAEQYSRAVAGVLDAELAGMSLPGLKSVCGPVVVTAESRGAVLLAAVPVADATPDRLAAAEAALRSVAGPLRAAIAAEIPRRRVPALRIRAVPGNPLAD